MPLWRRIPVSIDQLDKELLEAPRDELAANLDDELVGLRTASACALALRGDTRAFETLVEGLAVSGLRYACLEALRVLGDRRALEPVKRVFGRLLLSPFDRTQAAGVLAGFGDASGRAHLLERIGRRRFTEDRGLAIEIAADLGMEEAVPLLERIAAERKQLFRGAALRALAGLDPGRVRPELVRVVRAEDEDPDVRADALEALAEIGGDGAREALEAAADSVHEEIADLARRHLE